jgi:hypothetical protein
MQIARPAGDVRLALQYAPAIATRSGILSA